MRFFLQILGVLILIPAVALLTIKLDKQNGDGPSILFPGGELVSGELHSGPEPDWSFTDQVSIVELQINDPMSSRRIFVMESDGKVYVPSGYMRSLLGRIWKEWAFQAAESDGLGVVRIEGIRYERQLVRVDSGPGLEGIVSKMLQKYGGGATPEKVAAGVEQIKNGDTWIFELAPRFGTSGVESAGESL